MITYNRSAFGFNLIVQLHGSAVYRAIVPSLIGVAIFFLWRIYYKPDRGYGEVLGHPYAVGALVASASFLVVFRANQGYARYWEGCGAVHHMMSKWMDSTTHAGVYHYQCDHYDDIKPPSYYDYPELNHLYLTRDRERGREWDDEDDDDDDEADSHLLKTHNTRQDSHQLSSSSRVDQTLDRRKQRKVVLKEEKLKRNTQAVVKSINYVVDKKEKKKKKKPTSAEIFSREKLERRGQSGSDKDQFNVLSDSTLPPMLASYPAAAVRSANRRTQSADDIAAMGSGSHLPPHEEASNYFEMLQRQVDKLKLTLNQPGKGKPYPLWGRPHMDGGWQGFFSQKNIPTKSEAVGNTSSTVGTFCIPNDPMAPPPNEGFASMQGGRTPPLYLQELAHLSSLLVAVALSTLRNDIDGSESPLTFYEPGSDWPAVDPEEDVGLQLSSGQGWTLWIRKFGFFLGMGRSPEEQTRYNAGRPLPVIGGVSDAEIRFLQMARGPYAKTMLCWNWLSEFMMREHLAGSMGKVGPPIVSRCIQFLGDGMIYYNHARKIMFIPFPFVHAQLSVLFILILIPTLPFLMDQWTDEAWVGSILTFFTILSLAGVNEVARELENPFRNVPNELPLVTFMAQYNEALITLYSGFHPDHFWDGEKLTGLKPLRQRKREQAAATATVAAETPASNGNSTDGIPLAQKVPKEGESAPKSSTTRVKPKLSRDEPPLAQRAEMLNNENDEIAQLKDQLAKQAKIIEQLCAKMEIVSPEKSTKQVEEAALGF